mmetsp:Transcript_16358/g.30081  ORF Transcript_16358/g.30081 Transcript_16358/m.30081 type:complete len:326 (-) Transcript_16358:16-993(-)
MDEYEARTPTFGSSVISGRSSSWQNRAQAHQAGECEDNQCAEEGCDPEECGDESRPPRETICFGLDKRPFLPLGLSLSTVASALCMIAVQMPFLRQLGGHANFCSFFFLTLFTVTLCCMVYATMADPGQFKESNWNEMRGLNDTSRASLPKRAHKAWLYKFPIRRYDHYCRWLMNAIGLLNHRSFFVMCTGLLIAAVCGALLDTMLLVAFGSSDAEWSVAFFIAIHLVYSCFVAALVGPILWLHIGFISRNELANEWKLNSFYVAYSDKAGDKIPVNDMSDEEFNNSFDMFEYDSSRNPWDRGCMENCMIFWFTPRHGAGELGEF